MNACPVNCSPQEFISHAKNGDFEQAVATITRNNPMGQTCGLICPDKFCMKACTRSRIDFAVNIPKVQATILENYRNPSAEAKAIRPNGRKVAVIGAGPAGLAAAAELGKQGYYVCLYEASDKIGGALNMIPDERLPYEVIAKDWSFIFNRDFITLYLTTKIGCPSDLFSQGFDGVIVATGEPNVTDLGIPGQEYAVSYMEYLHHPSKYETKGRVAVIGGGLVGIEALLHIEKTASQVYCIEMMDDILKTATHLFNNDQSLRDRMAHSGCELHLNTKVVSIDEAGLVCSCGGESFRIDCDTVVLAIGLRSNNELEEALWGKVKVLRTIGDAAKAPGLVYHSVNQGFHMVRTLG